MDAEKNIPVNEEDIVYLTDEEGKEHPCLILDCIDFNDKEYYIIQDLEDEEHSDEAIVMEKIQEEDDNITFEFVEDDAIADAVFEFYLDSCTE